MTELLQLYYTSCKKGLSTGAGFQTYSMSDGITHDERLEIEKNGIYVPPNDLPSQPTQEEITRLFPITFKFFRLKSGRYGVCQSVYSGQDYSSRFGNYFCHAIILKNGIFPFYPIQLFRSSLFRKQLTKDEADIQESPLPLSSIHIDNVTLDGGMTFDSISNFIDENDRGEIFKAIITSIIHYENSNRRLVLCDISENIPYWIGAIQMAFPIDMVHNITFTTYTFDPEGDNSIICATNRTGGKFQFSDYQKEYQFFIYDFSHNDFSLVDKTTKFAEIVNTSYMFSPDSLRDFHAFIKNFNYTVVNNEIDYAFNLFQITNSGLDQISYDDIAHSIEYANKYASAELLGKLSQKISSLIDVMSQKLDFNVASIMTKFLFKISFQTKDKKHTEIAYDFFLTSLSAFIFQKEHQIDTDKILNYNNMTLIYNKNHSRTFIQHYANYLELLKKEFKKYPGVLQAKTCVIVSVNNFLAAKMSWQDAAQNKFFLPFIGQCALVLKESEKELYDTLNNLSADIDYFSQFLALCMKTKKDYNSLMSPFIQIMSTKNDKVKTDIRNYLITLEYNEFVINEFLILLKQSNKPMDFFWDYYRSIFMKHEKFKNKYFSIAIKHYLDLIHKKHFFEEGYKLLNYYSDIKLPELRNIITSLESCFSCRYPSNDELMVLNRLNDVKANVNISMSLDITRILLIGVMIKQDIKRNIKLSDLLKKNKGLLVGLNEKKYKSYLDWFLPAALDYFPDKNKRGDILFHKHLIECVIQKNTINILAKIYIKFFHKLIKQLKSKKATSEFIFFLSFFLEKSKDDDLEHIKMFMIDDIVSILSNNKSMLKEINKTYSNKKSLSKDSNKNPEKTVSSIKPLKIGKKYSRKPEWSDIYQMAIEKKEPFYKRLFSRNKNNNNELE